MPALPSDPRSPLPFWIALLLLALPPWAALADRRSKPAPVPVPTKATDSTLSVLEPKGDECVWVRVDAQSKSRQELASVSVRCAGMEIAWSMDGTRAALQGFDANGLARLWEVTLTTGASRSLSIPHPEMLVGGIGYDDTGKLHVLSIEPHDTFEEEGGVRYAPFEGQRTALAPAPPGNALVHDFALGPKDNWTHVEMLLSRACSRADQCPGVTVLEVASHLGNRASDLRQRTPEFSFLADMHLDVSLDTVVPGPRAGLDGAWVQLKAMLPTYVWRDGKTRRLTGAVAFSDGRHLLPAPDNKLDRSVEAELVVRGQFLLLAGTDGAHARLIDLKTHRALWASDMAVGTLPWPPAGRPKLPGAVSLATFAATPDGASQYEIERGFCRRDRCELVVRLSTSESEVDQFVVKTIRLPAGAIEQEEEDTRWVVSPKRGNQDDPTVPVKLSVHSIQLSAVLNGLTITADGVLDAKGVARTAREILAPVDRRMKPIWSKEEESLLGGVPGQIADVDGDGPEEIFAVGGEAAHGDAPGRWTVYAWGWNPRSGELQRKTVPLYGATLLSRPDVRGAEADREAMATTCAPVGRFIVVDGHRYPRLFTPNALPIFISPLRSQVEQVAETIRACPGGVPVSVSMVQ